MNYPAEKIILFGSYAYGEPKKGSDIDLLVVVKKSDLPRFKRAWEVRTLLRGKIRFPKDILVYTEEEINDWKNVPEAFITTIIGKGKILYERQK